MTECEVIKQARLSFLCSQESVITKAELRDDVCGRYPGALLEKVAFDECWKFIGHVRITDYKSGLKGSHDPFAFFSAQFKN